MSDTAYTPAQLDMREQLARIDRSIAETGKLIEENQKFVAEAHKLSAETRKMNREYGLAPWVLTVAVVGGLLGIASFLGRAFQLLP